MVLPEFTIENMMKIYFYLAVFATVLFVLKLALFSIIGGGDGEVSSDFTSSVDTDPSFSFISIQSILAFLMGFGWMGYAGFHQFGFTSQLYNFSTAFCVGFIFMFINACLMFLVRKLEKNVKKDKNSALNHVGRAYTSFEPGAIGQVEMEINGQLSVVNAMNNSEDVINSFDLVKVVKVVEDLLYIEKIKK